MKKHKTINIYFSDLSKEKQQELLGLYKIKKPQEVNWDLYPILLISQPENLGDFETDKEGNRIIPIIW